MNLRVFVPGALEIGSCTSPLNIALHGCSGYSRKSISTDTRSNDVTVAAWSRRQWNRIPHHCSPLTGTIVIGLQDSPSRHQKALKFPPATFRRLEARNRQSEISFPFNQSRRRLLDQSLIIRSGKTEEFDLEGELIAEDFYAVLGLLPDATPDEIKRAYYSCMKACHPDLSGNNPEATAFCMFVNDVYEVLSDPEMRAMYDEINGYSLNAVNPFLASNQEKDHAFVDEFTCIGCKNCANTAEKTFEMEALWGRARVCSQKNDSPALVQEAINTCPVNCIHWVSPAQLTLLEDEMRRMERINVGMMLAGMGSRKQSDVFGQASWRWEKRQAQVLSRARERLERDGRKKKSAWESVIFGSSQGREAPGDPSDRVYSKDKAVKAAAAARRWREYSRQGVDRRAVRAISVNASSANLQLEEPETDKTLQG